MHFAVLIMLLCGIASYSSVFGGSDTYRHIVSSAGAVRVQSGGKSSPDGFEEFKQGQAHGNRGEFEKAIEAFNLAQSKGLTLYELFVFRGFAYHETKDYQRAKNDAERAIALQPGKALGYELQAGVHYALGDAEGAIKALTEGIKRAQGEDKAKLHKARGMLSLKLGRQEDAISDLSRAAALGQETALLYYNRGRAYTELGRYEPAIQDFSKALTIDPGHDRSLRDRGWVYGCIGQFEKGVEDFNKLLVKSPGNVLAYAMRGWARLEAGDVDGGLGDLVYAVEHGDKNPLTFANAASAYYLKGDVKKALEMNGQGLALKDLESASALQFQRGLLLLVSGQEKDAQELYRKAKTGALKRSERIQLQEAIADLKEAIKFHPHIAASAESILEGLHNALGKTSESRGAASKQCQQLRSRDE